MPRLLTILSAVCCLFGIMVASASARPPRDVDWLVYGRDYPAVAKLRIDGERLVLTNGLIERTFMLGPNGATIGYDNLITGETITRGVKPEAIVTLNGRRFEVGGLKGQPNYAYLDPAWIDELTSDPTALQYIGYVSDSHRGASGLEAGAASRARCRLAAQWHSRPDGLPADERPWRTPR
jgi:hypothetical protein